jgi:alpha-N-arabinofuranosidase
MHKHRITKVVLAVLISAGLANAARAQQLSMSIDASKTGAPISPYMYGYFTELLGNNEGGYWAEMLSDRKFFYPVDDSPTPKARARRVYVRWKPLGAQEFVTMDKAHAWVGEHSPLIKLEAATPHGVQQAELGLRKGKRYTGRVILSGDPGAEVKVSLVWGPGPGDRQTIAIKALKSEYAKYPLSFTAGADTDNASFEITGTGKGTFHIGAASLMPADNVDGFRADLIEEMKKIGPALFRWPGGNMVSGYDWRDGIGDADKRPPRFDFAWNLAEQNDVGIDDYMRLNKLLGMEPYICVNTGFGDAHSAAQEVEYVNGSVNTPMGKWRAENGHPEPYHVKWWNVGNEMFGAWQLGYMKLDQYVIKHNMVVQAMRGVDPMIKVVAAGASPIEASQSRAALMTTGKHVADFGSSEDFTGGLLANSSEYLDAIAEHLYPSTVDKAFDAEKQDFVKVDETLTDQSRKLANGIHMVVEAWAEYQRRFPSLQMDHIPVSMDEWLSGRMGDDRDWMFSPLSTAQGFNEMLRHSNMFVISAYTGAPELLVISKTDVAIRPVGLMFELYRRHFGTIPVAIAGNSPPHEVKGTLGVDKPKTPAGSETYPLDAVAALTADRKALTIAIVNPTESEQQMNLTLQGAAPRTAGGFGRVWRIASNDLTAANLPGKPPQVEIVETALKETPSQLQLPKFSISIYELPIQ